MSERLAIFGGVYNNDHALAAVLADIERTGASQTWCLGDLGGFGPHPNRVIERLREAHVPSLRGNYDDSVGHDRDDCACGYSDPRDRHFAQVSFDYTVARTSSANKTWLRALPERARFELDGRLVLLCHGSPRRVNEFLWESTCSDAFLESLCDIYKSDLIVCGHSGLPWHRALPSGRHVVNAGSIGRPANDGQPGAVYARIEVGQEIRVEMRRVGYDHDAFARDMREEALPEEFVETVLTGWWTTCLENLPARERSLGRH